MMHEASLHEENAFVTLTYSDENLPEGGSLDRRAVPLFLKRLRKRIAPRRLRYFQVGEYGEKLGRPHYHALLFGYDFPDKVRISARKEYPEWTSETLETTWGAGRCLVGSVNFESAAYAARYVTKKVTGDLAAAHYRGVEPEYATMSRQPGLGRGWFEQFGNEVYPNDRVISRGHPGKPPRYYDSLLEEAAPFEAWMVKRERELAGETHTEERLKSKEKVATARLNLKGRVF